MSELEVCPCCGAEAVLETMRVRKGWEADIQCTDCGLNMHTITLDTEEEAITVATDKWNRRAISSTKKRLDDTNEPLTKEQLYQRNKPVWVESKASWIPEGGYYALCNQGRILPPSMQIFPVEECLKNGWVFFDHPPERSENGA